MTKLRKSVNESTGTRVKVKVDKVKIDTSSNLVIYDPDTSLSIGKFGINNEFYDALAARIDGEFPAKMYKKDDEILGLEMFGYVTMVSRPKS